MLSHIVSDLHQHYIREFIEPKIGKDSSGNKPEASSSSSDKSEDDIAKQARQLVYDVRYRARREDIPLEKAYTQHIGNSPAPSKVKEIAKEKLFGKSGSPTPSTPVKENYVKEESEAKKFQVRVTDKSSGKTYVRMATREKINQLRANPNIASVEMTKYGQPYEGEAKKGELTAKAKSGKGIDYDGDGKVESSSKEHAGVVHNAIQRAKGGNPDGKDTRKKVKKSHGVSEAFSNWREELIEIANSTKEEKNQKIKEKKVKNKVVVNPELKLEDVVKNLGGNLIDIVEEELSIDEEMIDIFEDVTNAEFYFIDNNLIEEIVYEFFDESLEEGYDIDFIIESALESLDESINLLSEENLMELNPYAPAGSKESKAYNKATTKSKRSADRAAKRAEKIQKIKGAVKRVGSSIKSGIKKAGKAVSHGAGYAAGKAVSAAKKVGSEVKSGYEKASKESKSTPKKSSSTYRYKKGKRTGTLEKVGSSLKSALKKGLKKAVSKTARSVSRGARNIARSMGEQVEISEKITGKTDIGTAIKDFSSSKSPQLAGRTKEERRKAAIAAVLTARRGGKKLGEAIVDQPTSADDKVRSTQKSAVDKQQLQNMKMIQQKKQTLDRQKLQMQKAGKLPLHASHELDGELVDEATAAAKRGLEEPHRPLKAMKKRHAETALKTPQGKRSLKSQSDFERSKQLKKQKGAKDPEGERREITNNQVKRVQKYGLTKKQKSMSDSVRKSGSLGS